MLIHNLFRFPKRWWIL